MPYPVNAAALANGIRYARQLGLEQRAAAGHCASGACAVPPMTGRPAPFVMQQNVNVQAPYFAAAPARFISQSTASAKSKIPHSERQRVVSQFAAGESASVTVPHATKRYVSSHASVAELQQAGAELLAAWTDTAQGMVKTTGSRVGHRGERKQYSFLKTNGVLVIDAQHRHGSALEIHPDGRLYLGGQEVKEGSSRKVQIRVANRLNAAENAVRARSHFSSSAPQAPAPVVAPPSTVGASQPLAIERSSAT